MIRIVVAAPYPTARAGLRAILTDQPDIDVVAVAGDIDELLAAVDEQAPDAVLLDLVDAPEEWLGQLAAPAVSTALPPLVLMLPAAVSALAVLSLPRASLLLRDTTLDEIDASLRSATLGLVTMDARIVAEIGEQLESAESDRAAAQPKPEVVLTAREIEVIQLIARGLPNKAIASDLGISEHTVKFHVGSMFQKLGVSSRSEALAVAARRGLIAL
jgi:DNA-binding NarL/FixJ family response regulator